MRVGVVILNWCDSDSTIKCVASLRASSLDWHSVHVIDNASTDGSFERLAEVLVDCDVYRNQTNSGYTGGNNVGMARAFGFGCDAVLILNNDILVHLGERFLPWVVEQLSRNDLSLLGVSVLDEKDGVFSFPAKPGIFVNNLVKSVLPNFREPFDLICGCAMVVSRKLYETVGGLDERFFMYCEELDYSLKAIVAGGGVKSVPKELGYVARCDSPELRPQYVYFYQSRNLLRIAIELTDSNRILNSSLAVLAAISFSLHSGSVRNVFMALRGVWHGLCGKFGKNESVHRAPKG